MERYELDRRVEMTEAERRADFYGDYMQDTTLSSVVRVNYMQQYVFWRHVAMFGKEEAQRTCL